LAWLESSDYVSGCFCVNWLYLGALLYSGRSSNVDLRKGDSVRAVIPFFIPFVWMISVFAGCPSAGTEIKGGIPHYAKDSLWRFIYPICDSEKHCELSLTNARDSIEPNSLILVYTGRECRFRNKIGINQ